MDNQEAAAGLVALAAADGAALRLHAFRPAGPARAVLLFSPALGMRAGYYDRLAAGLAEHGVATYLHEQRGHGASPLRPSWRCDFGYRELVEFDLPAMVDWIRAQHPGLPLVIGGHSLGGQLSALYAAAHPGEADGVILVACATPHFRAFPAPMRNQIRIGSRLFVASSRLLGHYPGPWFGFGGREARGLIADWSRLARHGRFVPAGSARDYEALLGRVRTPVLCLHAERDSFGPLQAVQEILDKMPAAPRTRVCLPADPAESPRQAHFSWARRPGAVIAEIGRWVDRLPVPRGQSGG